MFLNNKEGNLIKNFLVNLDKYESNEMILIWNNKGKIIARFDTCFEDENEFDKTEAEYEEFTTFVFEVVSIYDNPPVFITEDNFFCINYHNFPDIIMVQNKKIN